MIEDELRASFARHEVLVPAVEPVREAIARSAGRRHRRRLVTRIVGAALAVAAVAGVPSVIRGAGSESPARPGLFPASAPSPAAVATPMNFLLLGLDRRAGSQEVPRADMIFVVHVPRAGGRAYVIAVPRDAQVRIPRGAAGGSVGKLDEAFAYGSARHGDMPDLAGGVALTEQVLGEMTGLRFDGAATVEFGALREITDAVGGVRICLSHPVRSIHTRRVFPAGCQRLDGTAALDLLRQRKGLPDGALDRDRNGVAYLAALGEQAVAGGLLQSPGRADALLGVAGLHLYGDSGALPTALWRMAQIPPGNLVGVTLKVGYVTRAGLDYVVPVPELTSQLFAGVRADRLADFLAGHPELVNPGQR